MDVLVLDIGGSHVKAHASSSGETRQFDSGQHFTPDLLVELENGAVLYDPRAKEVHTLAPAPPPVLIEMLQRAAVPLSVGHSIIATVTPHEPAVLEAIPTLGLEWHVIFNKRAVIALPSSVTKASGLAAAFEVLELSADATMGIGDAENDHAFLDTCGLSVAVANAVPSVKDHVDIVTKAARGSGSRS